MIKTRACSLNLKLLGIYPLFSSRDSHSANTIFSFLLSEITHSSLSLNHSSIFSAQQSFLRRYRFDFDRYSDFKRIYRKQQHSTSWRLLPTASVVMVALGRCDFCQRYTTDRLGHLRAYASVLGERQDLDFRLGPGPTAACHRQRPEAVTITLTTNSP